MWFTFAGPLSSSNALQELGVVFFMLVTAAQCCPQFGVFGFVFGKAGSDLDELGSLVRGDGDW
jgi:hypothetical protein